MEEEPKRRFRLTLRSLHQDKYEFRGVIWSVLTLPCGAAWFYVLLFRIQTIWLVSMLAFFLGLGTAYVLAWFVVLGGHAAISWVDRLRG